MAPPVTTVRIAQPVPLKDAVKLAESIKNPAAKARINDAIRNCDAKGEVTLVVEAGWMNGGDRAALQALANKYGGTHEPFGYSADSSFESDPKGAAKLAAQQNQQLVGGASKRLGNGAAGTLDKALQFSGTQEAVETAFLGVGVAASVTAGLAVGAAGGGIPGGAAVGVELFTHTVDAVNGMSKVATMVDASEAQKVVAAASKDAETAAGRPLNAAEKQQVAANLMNVLNELESAGRITDDGKSSWEVAVNNLLSPARGLR